MMGSSAYVKVILLLGGSLQVTYPVVRIVPSVGYAANGTL